MKRLFVLGLAIMALGVNAFAAGGGVIEKLGNESVFNGIVKYLDAGYQQSSDLRYIFDETARRYEKETARGKDASEAAQKAFHFNLANAKVILSPEQYRKFVRVLNVSVYNEVNNTYLAEK